MNRDAAYYFLFTVRQEEDNVKGSSEDVLSHCESTDHLISSRSEFQEVDETSISGNSLDDGRLGDNLDGPYQAVEEDVGRYDEDQGQMEIQQFKRLGYKA